MSTKTKPVILLKSIINGVKENGKIKFVRYTPGKPVESKVTNLPIELYNDFKNTKPPTFVDKGATEETVDGGEEINIGNAVPTGTNSEEITPTPSIEIEEGGDTEQGEGPEDGEKVGPSPSGAVPVPAALPTATAVSEDASTEDAEAKSFEEEVQEIKGVGAGIADALVAAGYNTLGDVAYADRSELVALSGISDNNVDGIQTGAKALLGE